MRLLRTSHLGPTLLVSAVSFFLAVPIWWEGSAFVIAFTVFTGQLVVGWTNDLADYETDLIEERKDKPLAMGTITIEKVIRATKIALFFCIIFSLLGPLGFLGGSVHLLGVGFGVAYNFYFKSTKLSPLPYAIAFAALPAAITLSKSIAPPLWLLFSGAGLGVASHFANVVKDFDRDIAAGIKGLPQLLGIRKSLICSGLIFLFVSLNLYSATNLNFLLFLGIAGAIAIIIFPPRLSFTLLMALALINVVVLITLGTGSLSSLV